MTSELEVTVRPCEAADVEVLTAAEPPGADVAVRCFARQERGESTFLVAWLGVEPVGTGELVHTDPFELRNLHVAPEHRGSGFGTSIVAAAELAARERGASSVVLGVGSDNHAARRLYERLGYTGTGELTTTTYAYVDDDGSHEATEIDERLVKRFD